MGLISSLKKLKLKKLKPGNILVAAAKKIGGPIGGIASAAEKINDAAHKIAGQAKQEARDLGLTPAQEAERVASQAANAATAYAAAGGPGAGDNAKNGIIIVAVLVVLFLLIRK